MRPLAQWLTTDGITLASMRLIPVAAIVLGVLSVIVSWGPLRNLFGGHGDSPASAYLLFGVPFLAIGLLLIVFGTWALQRRQ